MLKNIKYIYFDLDGTILDKNKTLRFNLIQKIIEIRNKYNIKFGLATGRHYAMVKYVAAKILPELPTITNNGASISYSDVKHIDLAVLSPLAVAGLVTFLQASRCDFFIYTSQRIYTNNQKNWRIRQLTESAIKNNLGPLMWKYYPLDHELISRENVLKILNCTPAKNQDISSYVQEHLPYVESTSSEADLLDLYNSSADKFYCIKYIMEEMDADMDELLYFGDNNNDYLCLKEIKHSVYVGKTNPNLSAVATYVTDSADQDGVLKFLEEHF
ncbi:Cof subfamily protein (haloacid dehalogenase superfamily) [Mycoplasmoides fastidiosum]|uniref:Cof subfamily protein (Haloacid dehalogenase superfamily) n=1 Tax=Mycoplasmoides fastidiosum TaxID=92758 RepID=A0ABU0LZS1_9BACT|nr:HAD family hydrolase [Mycoplasmoides fastidiosum]MDQ0514208.1 Cof subfamily protein (haloacid dehalogenase superfamily) [Mycoplasmoides fastidiosum]UUD37383.1 Cof-type HAD-IIB family hydrolase [Mycoplasmoides fastidiosum]